MRITKKQKDEILVQLKIAAAGKLAQWDAERAIEAILDKGDFDNMNRLLDDLCAGFGDTEDVTRQDVQDYVDGLER
jgi:hypothetical protein